VKACRWSVTPHAGPQSMNTLRELAFKGCYAKMTALG
jgi:hypothetical protein